MSRLKIVDAAHLEKVLFHIGFERVRQKKSHIFYRHPDGRRTTIPHHGSRSLARPLLREILREIELTVDEYHEILDRI
jgi:predicted RNA binding protein YcfA (HicA-like mRNA interferase family)